jgi:hypothetical protein
MLAVGVGRSLGEDMSSRIRVFAVGILVIGLTSAAQAQPGASLPHRVDRIDICGLQALWSHWLTPFFARDRVPASPGSKRNPRGSRQLQEKEGSHMDPNGLH